MQLDVAAEGYRWSEIAFGEPAYRDSLFERRAARAVNHYDSGFSSSERLRNVIVGSVQLIKRRALITPRERYGIEHLYLIIGVASVCVFRLPSCHNLVL